MARRIIMGSGAVKATVVKECLECGARATMSGAGTVHDGSLKIELRCACGSTGFTEIGGPMAGITTTGLGGGSSFWHIDNTDEGQVITSDPEASK